MRKPVQLPGVTGRDRAYELADGRRVVVRVRRRELPRSGAIGLVVRALEVDELGEVLEEAPCCPGRVCTVQEAALADGRIELHQVLEVEIEQALERFERHRAALMAVAEIEEDDE